MRAIRYVLLNPTGNLTCLVLDPVAEEERQSVTGALLTRCEQVGYLTPPAHPENRARLQMMGGEFCGNASMAAAAYLCREDGLLPDGERRLTLEVSGAGKPVACRIRVRRSGEETLWEGTVEMPRVLEVQPVRLAGEELTAVRLEGIAHLIREGVPLDREKAESLLRRCAEAFSEPAAGLLQWDPENGFMTPLVWVKGSGSLVWETGCGSGTTAVAAREALRAGEGVTEIPVRQPGGTIRAAATVRGGRVVHLEITGEIELGEEEQIFPEAGIQNGEILL